jgi:2-methylcitrate dehydratase PrpD
VGADVSTTVLEQLGTFVAQSGPPSPRLRDLLALHVVDITGAWAASLRTAEGAALLGWRRTLGEGREPGGMPQLRLDVATHCAMARLSEIDDIHLASTTTPGAIVVPGALTIAAACGIRDPSALAAAMTAGYEVMIRLGQAIDGASVLYRGIWPTYFATPLGIAAVAARLFALDGRQTAHALTLALVRSAPGVGHHNAATTSRWLAIGQAAEAGLTATLAARAGFTSDLALLDGSFMPGIYNLKPDPGVLTEGLGERSGLPDLSFKPWCAARQTMAATQAMREIVATGVAADTITQVQAFVLPPHRRMIDHDVTFGDRASFLTSLPYQMALAALAPHAACDIGQPPGRVGENIRAFMAKVAIAPDESLLAGFPQQWPARVEVFTSSGRHQRLVTHVPGDPARPFDAAAVREKFRRFTEPSIGTEASARMLEHALGLLNGQTAAADLVRDIAQVGEAGP